MIREMIMIKYKVRLIGLGIEAVAVIPLEKDPSIETIENSVAYYLNNKLMKVEPNDFYMTDKYVITYEELSI
jgi:hypothetical protein